MKDAGLPGARVEARRVAVAAPAGAAAPAPGEFTYTVLEESRERRGAARQRQRLRSGKLVRRDGQFLCECLVYNRSPTGGRIRLQAGADLPAALYFYDDQSDELFEALVVWRRDREIGLKLVPCNPTATHRAIANRMHRKFYALKR